MEYKLAGLFIVTLSITIHILHSKVILLLMHQLLSFITSEKIDTTKLIAALQLCEQVSAIKFKLVASISLPAINYCRCG